MRRGDWRIGQRSLIPQQMDDKSSILLMVVFRDNLDHLVEIGRFLIKFHRGSLHFFTLFYSTLLPFFVYGVVEIVAKKEHFFTFF